jgi:hypothetical protein
MLIKIRSIFINFLTENLEKQKKVGVVFRGRGVGEAEEEGEDGKGDWHGKEERKSNGALILCKFYFILITP